MPVITEIDEDVKLRVGPKGDGPDAVAEVAKGDGSEETSSGSRAMKIDGSGDDDDDDSDMPPLESFDAGAEESSADKATKKKEKKIVIEDEEPEKEVDEDGWLDVLGSGELKKKVIKPGLGKDSRPQRSNWVVLNVKGTLEDGTVFEEHNDWRIILGGHGNCLWLGHNTCPHGERRDC
ncbi:hypothetical protein MRX96_032808 [Rhipicephalus microplus]